MSVESTPAGDATYLAVVGDVPQQTLAAMRASHTPSLSAVVSLSVHLAAVQHAIVPQVSRVLDDSRAVESLRSGSLGVERRLRVLELYLTGDVTALDKPRAIQALIDAVDAQSQRETRVLQRLAGRLSDDEQRALAEKYMHALLHAPSRPHPNSPHGATLGSLAFHVNSWRDRVMDTLDSRYLPVQRRLREPLRHGRLRRGLMGQPPPPE